MNLALFDFDGTITTRDSFLDFILYSTGINKFLLGMTFLSPALLAFKLKIIKNQRAKEIVLTYFFKGMTQTKFDDLASKYSDERLPRIIRKTAMDRIDWHKSKEDRIVVVSASVESWMSNWCKRQDIDLIGSNLEVVDSCITGKLSGKNCYGHEKVARIKQNYNLAEYGNIYAYGDSRGDKEMIGLADHKYYNWKKQAH